LPAEQPPIKKAAGGKKPPLWKRIPKWLLILAVIFLCGCLCLSTLVVGGTISDRQHQRATQTALALTPPPIGFGPTPEVSTPTQKTTKEFSIPEDARDSWNLLQQGFAFLDQGNPDAANKVFDEALQAMPSGRAGVIALAAQKLGSRGQWITAGKFCQKGSQGVQNDASLRIVCEEVYFHVAESPDGKDMLSGLADQLPQWSIAQAAYGRWLAAFSAQHTDGEPYIRSSINLARLEEKPIVSTILGEYLCITGQTVKGLNSLTDVLKDPITPPWLRVEAEKIISKWQPK
jgi:hypothetical protein